jgi:hypothetical protein
MIEQAFNSFYKDSTSKYLVIEQQEGIIKHLTHLEELILTRQKEGLDTAIEFINALTDSFNGNTDSGVFTTVKYDGAPAIICGFNPENNKFFVSTKSIAAKTPKINYTVQDIEQNYSQAPGLAEKMKLALLYLPKVIKSNVYQCDFMFDKATLNQTVFEGEKLITFKPNTITYAVEVDSELGKKIQTAQIGVVFHTRYTGPNLQQLSKSADVNVSEFSQSPDVWFDDAKFKDMSGTVTLTDDEKVAVSGGLNSMQKIAGITDWVGLPNNFYTLANTYINTLIRQGKFVEDLEETFNGFIEWYNSRMDKEIEKLKSEAGKQKKIEGKNKAIEFFNTNKMSIVNIFNLTKKIADIKKIFFNKYSTAIKTKQFLTQPDGTLKVTPGEGFVAVDKSGNMVKLVDRLEFSRANFAISREEKFK